MKEQRAAAGIARDNSTAVQRIQRVTRAITGTTCRSWRVSRWRSAKCSPSYYGISAPDFPRCGITCRWPTRRAGPPTEVRSGEHLRCPVGHIRATARQHRAVFEPVAVPPRPRRSRRQHTRISTFLLFASRRRSFRCRSRIPRPGDSLVQRTLRRTSPVPRRSAEARKVGFAGMIGSAYTGVQRCSS